MGYVPAAVVLLAICLAGSRGAAGQNPASETAGHLAEPSGVSAGQGNCSACHAEVVTQLAANPHSRGAQKIECNDCHQPHGDSPRRVAHPVAEQNATCTGCHSAMAGPFAYEHPPVKVEGCVSCHAAHGNREANDLILGGAPGVCLQCHDISKASLHAHDISAAGLVRDRSGQSVPCTDCHSHIHGSNVSKVFFKPRPAPGAGASTRVP